MNSFMQPSLLAWRAIEDNANVLDVEDDGARVSRLDEYGHDPVFAAVDELRENHVLARWLGPQEDGRLKEWDDLMYAVAQEEATELDELLEGAGTDRHEALVEYVTENHSGLLQGGREMARKRRYEDGEFDVVVEQVGVNETVRDDSEYDDAGNSGRKVKKRSTWNKNVDRFGDDKMMALVDELLEVSEGREDVPSGWLMDEVERAFSEELEWAARSGPVNTVRVDEPSDMVENPLQEIARVWRAGRPMVDAPTFERVEARGVEVVSIRGNMDVALLNAEINDALFGRGVKKPEGRQVWKELGSRTIQGERFWKWERVA